MKKNFFVFPLTMFLVVILVYGCEINSPSGKDDFKCPANDDDDSTATDDDDNDDNDDNNDNDDSGPPYPPDEGVYIGDMFLQMVAGGAPGHDGTAIAADKAGQISIAAINGRILYVYSFSYEKSWTRERVAYFASTPDIAVDSSGFLHLAYKSNHPDALGYATNKSGTWETQVVDVESENGRSPSIDIGPGDFPRICYLDQSMTELKVATDQGKGWDIQTAVSGTVQIIAPSLSVDQNNHGHISFTFTQTGIYIVYYVTDSSGNWVKEQIAPDSRRSSIVLDANGFVHISHLNVDWWGRMSYTTNKTGEWVTIQFDSSSNFFGDSAIEVDSKGFVHIAYGNSQEGLRYANNAQGDLLTTIISDEQSDGWFSSMAIGTEGDIYVAHFNDDESALRVTSFENRNWTTQTVDSGKAVEGKIERSDNRIAAAVAGQKGISLWERKNGVWVEDSIEQENSFSALSLSFDPDGYAHIAYKDDATGELIHATDMQGSWIVTYADTTSDVGDMTSIRAGIPDVLKIVYFDVLTGELKVAGSAAKSWTTEAVENPGAGHCVALAIDALGKSHISYEGAGRIRYATDESGTWVIEEIDSTPYTGEYCSIALSSDGEVSISYSDRSNDDLKYAMKENGTWELATVDTAGVVGKYNSLALDSAQAGHIVYRSDSDSALKYAANPDGDFETIIVDGIGDVGLSTSMVLGDTDDSVHALYMGEYAFWYAVFPQMQQAR